MAKARTNTPSAKQPAAAARSGAKRAAPRSPATRTQAATRTKAAAARPAAKPAAARAANSAQPGRAAATSRTSFLDRIVTYRAPDGACGLHRVPTTLAANAQAAALLGLGYPHLLVTVDEPLAPLPDYATYRKRYLNAPCVPRALVPILHAIRRAVPSTEALDEAVRAPPPVELPDAVERALRYGGATTHIIEALFGAGATAAAFVDALDAATVDDLCGGKYENYGYATVYQLGWLLWRVPATERDAHRARLAGVLDRLRAADKMWRLGRALDVILGGRAGVERHGRGFRGQLFLDELVWADDDPAWVASMVASRLQTLRPAEREVFDIQLAVVGGPRVLAALRDATARFRKDQQKSIAAQLALCA